jgi:hypothetical protein
LVLVRLEYKSLAFAHSRVIGGSFFSPYCTSDT